MDVVCENNWFNSPASFCDKYKRLLFTSRDLGGANGAKFYNEQAELCTDGTYYLTQIGSLDSTHPGAHEEIQEKGISICRNNTGVRQSIDGTGEQTFMRNSRTAGNYISFLMCTGCSYLFLFWGGKHFYVFNSWTTLNCLISNHTSLSYLSLYSLIEGNYLDV